MLAAHDIQTALKEQFPRVWVSCYTLGSPRVGNRTFADTFNNSGELRASMAISVSATLHRDRRRMAARWGQQTLRGLRMLTAGGNPQNLCQLPSGVESWSVINDQDAVARGGKLLGLFKRAGERVLMNAKGNASDSGGLCQPDNLANSFLSCRGHARVSGLPGGSRLA